MPPLNETIGVSICFGKISIISVPVESAPRGLDWSRWILNAAVKYRKSNLVPSKKVTVLDAKGVQFEHMKGAGLEFSRRDLQSVDPITLFQDTFGGELLVSHGSWGYALSSWVESAIRIANSIFHSELKNAHESQFNIWSALAIKFLDDSEFILSDSGSKFLNVSSLGRSWIERISRSRTIGDIPRGGWCAAIVEVLGSAGSSGNVVTFERILKLKPLDWCGDPAWGKNSLNSLASKIADVDEIWISVPSVGLTLQILAQISAAGIDKKGFLVAPSIAVGWHPIRDYFMCLGSSAAKKVFVYLDYMENLHFILIQSVRSQGVPGGSNEI